MVGFGLAGAPLGAQTPAAVTSAHDPGALDTWLAINRDGKVTAFTGRVDLGTGVETAFAQVVAEELAVPFAAVHVVMGDTDHTADQGRTTASQGMLSGVQPLLVAAARARAELLELAAQRWRLDADRLDTANGRVFVKNNPAQSLGYGELIGNQRFNIALDVQSVGQWGPVLRHAVRPKSPADYGVVGKSIPRVDVPAKVFGTFEYVHNLRLPGMLHARVLRRPEDRGRLLRIDHATLPAGLRVRVVQQRDFVAIVGEHEAQVVQAAQALHMTWEDGRPLPSGAGVPRALRVGTGGWRPNPRRARRPRGRFGHSRPAHRSRFRIPGAIACHAGAVLRDG